MEVSAFKINKSSANRSISNGFYFLSLYTKKESASFGRPALECGPPTNSDADSLMHMGLTFCFESKSSHRQDGFVKVFPRPHVPSARDGNPFLSWTPIKRWLFSLTRGSQSHSTAATHKHELPSERAPRAGRADAPPEKTGPASVRGSQTSLWFSFHTRQSPAGDDSYTVASTSKCVNSPRSRGKKKKPS